MNITSSTLEAALIALRRQYAELASQPKPAPGTGDSWLRNYALVSIRSAIAELQEIIDQRADE